MSDAVGGDGGTVSVDTTHSGSCRSAVLECGGGGHSRSTQLQGGSVRSYSGSNAAGIVRPSSPSTPHLCPAEVGYLKMVLSTGKIGLPFALSTSSTIREHPPRPKWGLSGSRSRPDHCFLLTLPRSSPLNRHPSPRGSRRRPGAPGDARDTPGTISIHVAHAEDGQVGVRG